MRFTVFIPVSCLLFFNSCLNSGDKKPNDSEALGNKVYGGSLRVNETEQYQSLYPMSITDLGSANIAGQIFEGLLKFNPKDLSIMPCLAEKWEKDSIGISYIFHLKKGVFFHDNDCFTDGKGREVKATDFEYSFQLLCTDTKENTNFSSTFKDCLAGANSFFETNKGKPIGKLQGVKVIDDYTLKLTLTSPSASFLYTLASPATSVVAKEAVEKYGPDIKTGTGPFIFSAKSNNEKLFLVRNNNYHRKDSLGNQLPFLDSVIFSFLPTKKQELECFQNENLSIIVGLPSESVKDMVETQIADFKNKPPKFVLERSPEMVTQYYEFNTVKPPFDNVLVRKAFCYAIDRNMIIENVLKGEAFGPGINGICPPSFKGYDVSKVEGYDFNPDKAKKLLADAGYPKGKGFPKVKIELNSGGSKNVNVILEIQKQLLTVLNINVDFEVVPHKQKLDDELYGKANIFRSAWVADFPSPENFLSILYGAYVPADANQPSYPNTSRYKNKEYDKLFDLGRVAKTEEESYSYFIKAEQLAMKDVPIMVLWYDQNYRLVKSNVRDFYSNPMSYFDFSEVYLKEVVPVKPKDNNLTVAN